jgi:uracil-DNA glycosylase
LEISACRPFLVEEIAALPNLRAILALGSIAHGSVVKTLGERLSQLPFRHGTVHELKSGLLLADSYHCSRYNTNTGRLTPEMFRAVFSALGERIR